MAAAGLVGGGRALVLHVWNTPDRHASAEDLVERLHHTAEQRAREVAAEGAGLARDAGFEAEPLAVETHGRLPEMILEQAERSHSPLVVMGSRGLSGVASVLLGSVSTTVLHAATNPVLVIPGGEG